ncbi:uncharacterized protein LOC142526624 isoform X1 [Primulina tabacum]|uniref:uncharacterized protein LOC142526624 isoform X1 n=1 Tax=Primulina tabacum TaxID=48773 RepID=UPI003F5973D7
MKRRRGSKKGKAKKPKLSANAANDVVSNVASLNTEDNSPLDDSDNVVDSGTDAETKPSPPEGGQAEVLSNAHSVGQSVNNTSVKAVYTRVKVKIKTSKNLESHHTSSDAPTLSDTEKSSQQFGSEKQLVPNDRMEDSSNSLSEAKEGKSGNISKKSMGIKIKSSKGFACSSMSPCSNTEIVKGDRTEKKDVELLHQDSKNNEQELKAALEVIRKVMKMDAAEPFNVPVNPVALGIPDYFDVIDTPMDFGTICSNLEKGVKYKNSEDVFRDVQYIWDNCYKYNNKGDYIVELMKRVRKNFAKYWITVGLFNDDQPQETNGVDSTPVTETTLSSQGNTPMESGAFSLSGKKFHGLKKHKEGCQCAICVMMRRRQEREEIVRMMGGTDDSDDSVGEDMKPEGAFCEQSPFGMYASSNIENHSDAERKGQDMKLGHIINLYSQAKENDVTITGKGEGSEDLGHRSGDENSRQCHTPHLASGGSISSETKKEMSVHDEDGNAALDQQKPKDFLDKKQRAKMLENLRYLENPMLLQLCGTLFAENSESFWNGPHSLVGRPRRRTSFHSAISKFME